jgi:hypothetical protein
MMRSGVVYFRFVAVMFVAFGLIGLVFVDQYSSLLGGDAGAGGRLWGRAFGAVSVGFGAMLWMMDPRRNQRARRIGAIGAALAFGLNGIVDVVSLVTGDWPASSINLGWVFVAFNAVMMGFALYYLFTPASSADMPA